MRQKQIISPAVPSEHLHQTGDTKQTLSRPAPGRCCNCLNCHEELHKLAPGLGHEVFIK